MALNFCGARFKLLHHFDDQRHVTVLQYLDHAVLVEGNAAARVGFRAFHMNKDSDCLLQSDADGSTTTPFILVDNHNIVVEDRVIHHEGDTGKIAG